MSSVGEDLLRAVLQGMPPGTVYALVALGFVLAYKTSGVFNLAFGAQAFVSAIAYYQFNTEWGWPIVPALLVSVFVIAPLLGLILERGVFRHLRTAPPVAGLVVSIGLATALPAIANWALRYEPRGGQTPAGIAPRGNNVFYDVWGVYTFSRNELVAMAVATVAALVLFVLFRFSLFGLQMRAVVESPRMTELNGIAADRVSASAWALSSLFAGLAGVLISPRFTNLSSGEYFNIVVIAIAAAAVGALVSLPRAYLGGLGLGILIALFNTFVPKWSNDLTWLRPIQENLTPAIPFLVLFAVIVLVPSVRASRGSVDPLAGVDPPVAASPSTLVRSSRSLITRAVWLAVLAFAVIMLFTRGNPVWVYLATVSVTFAVVLLSVTVVTGMGGHISLCQGVFAAIGGFTMYQLYIRYDVPLLLGILIGAVIAAAVAVLLTVPLRRLNGIWIAIATLAFAYFFDSVMVPFSWVGGTPDTSASQVVPRPSIGSWTMDDDKQFLLFAGVVLAVVYIAVTLFGRSTTGRVLGALRGSEVAAQSIGISPARARIIVFAVSGFVAAIGGGLIAAHQEAVNYPSNFSPFSTLLWLVLVVTFAARRPVGALFAGVAFGLFDKLLLQGAVIGWILGGSDRIPGFFPIPSDWRLIMFGLALVQYAKYPDGVLAMMDARRARRAQRAETPPGTAAPAPPPPDRGSTLEEAVR